jgi:hypothetical protein
VGVLAADGQSRQESWNDAELRDRRSLGVEQQRDDGRRDEERRDDVDIQVHPRVIREERRHGEHERRECDRHC